MLENLINKKIKEGWLSAEDYKVAINYLMEHGLDDLAVKFFKVVCVVGMDKDETLDLTLAIRDSGRVMNQKSVIFEKHSTGGIADSTSLIIIPVLASLGYKIIKTTGKSFVYTNGSADRFGAIPGFRADLSNKEIDYNLQKYNACVLSHKEDICPADRILYDFREKYGYEKDLNLLAASIASKKLASGANVVLVDVKYGVASVVKTYKEAMYLAKLLKYMFKKCNVKSVIVISDTIETIGESIGNAIEVADALDVLNGKKCLLREVAALYSVEMICASDKRLKRKDVYDMVYTVLDTGSAYKRFLEIVKAQGGDISKLQDNTFFKPYKIKHFIAEKEGYVGPINSLLLGEVVRRICSENHDNNLGIVLRVKVGDYIKVGDKIVTFYYKKDEDLQLYKKSIETCIGLTSKVVKPAQIIRQILR